MAGESVSPMSPSDVVPDVVHDGAEREDVGEEAAAPQTVRLL